MIRHYLTFAHQAALLHRAFAGATIVACWGQEKDRLSLACETPRGLEGIEIAVDLRIGYALPVAEIHPPKRNRIDLFGEIEGERIEEVDIDPAERALHVLLRSGRELVAPFYGPGGGNLLLVEGEDVLDSYRGVGDEYRSLLLGSSEMEGEEWDPAEITADPAAPLRRGLTRAHRRLGPRLAREAIALAGLDPEGETGDLAKDDVDRLVVEADRLYAEAESSRTYHIYRNNEEVVFSLVPLTTLSPDEFEVDHYEELPRAIRRYRSLYFRTERFSSLKRRGLAALEKEEGKLAKSLEHALESEAHLTRAEEWEKMGNLLLANLHAIDRGVKKALLDDWEGGSLEVKLDPRLTPAENANRFFRKARGARLEAERGVERAEGLAERLAAVEEKIERVKSLDHVDQFDELRLLTEGVVQQKGEKKEDEREDRFRRFTVTGGLEVYAGKNARNNDELTGRFARPNDIWLHARGTSGSHVVLRWDRREENPPAAALGEAAMIAAYYSGARGSELVPVAWTRRKYIRKPKGAAPGAVVMTREEVLMVEPSLPPSVTGKSDHKQS